MNWEEIARARLGDLRKRIQKLERYKEIARQHDRCKAERRRLSRERDYLKGELEEIYRQWSLFGAYGGEMAGMALRAVERVKRGFREGPEG